MGLSRTPKGVLSEEDLDEALDENEMDDLKSLLLKELEEKATEDIFEEAKGLKKPIDRNQGNRSSKPFDVNRAAANEIETRSGRTSKDTKNLLKELTPRLKEALESKRKTNTTIDKVQSDVASLRILTSGLEKEIKKIASVMEVSNEGLEPYKEIYEEFQNLKSEIDEIKQRLCEQEEIASSLTQILGELKEYVK